MRRKGNVLRASVMSWDTCSADTSLLRVIGRNGKYGIYHTQPKSLRQSLYHGWYAND